MATARRGGESPENRGCLRPGGFLTRYFLLILSASFLLLGGSGGSEAAEDAFRTNCEKTVGVGKVLITYADSVPTYNTSHSAKSLQSRLGMGNDGYHSIYGLTHAEPSFRVEIRSRLLVSQDVGACMVPDVSVKMGFSAMQVYRAKELQDDCRKNIVREHELEHVSTWRSHFRIGARMLEEPLRAAFSQPRHYANEKQAQADLKPWVEEVLKPLQHELISSVMAAQRAIDSPASYERVRQRLRTCPPIGS